MDYKKMLQGKVDRRRLLGNLGLMGAGAVITACGAGAVTPEPEPEPEANLDPAILNFALNLEYLEAAYYLAAVGRIDEILAIGGDAEIILPDGFDGTSPMDFGDPAIESYANEIAEDELNHVKFLVAALGDGPVAARPTLDLGPAFVTAAAAALEVSEEDAAGFNPFANGLFFLHGAFIFEDVGVTAYAGAAPYITDKAVVLLKAAGILAVEAYHAGEIRTLLYDARDTTTPFGVTVTEVVQAISNLRGSVGGGKDQGIVVDGEANIVAADESGIAFARTPAEVAAIVYLGSATTPGGFYPEGISVPDELAEDFGTLLSL
jgi:hypothetical protein